MGVSRVIWARRNQTALQLSSPSWAFSSRSIDHHRGTRGTIWSFFVQQDTRAARAFAYRVELRERAAFAALDMSRNNLVIGMRPVRL